MMRKPKYSIRNDVDISSIIDAIAAEKEKILNNINDGRADPKKERKTILTIHYKPDPETARILISADIVSSIAPLQVKEAQQLATQISFDDMDPEDQE